MAKQVGIREVARLARVSTGTVDRTLNGRKEINEKTRQNILKIAEEYMALVAVRAAYEITILAKSGSARDHVTPILLRPKTRGFHHPRWGH